MSAQLLVAYLRQRSEQFGRVDGALFLSQSRRNRGKPLGLSSWSKIVTGIAQRAHVRQLSTHTFRHLRLTDLARANWTIDEIAQYAGHRDLSTTLKYIHLSGRELAAKMHKAVGADPILNSICRPKVEQPLYLLEGDCCGGLGRDTSAAPS